MNQIRCLIRKEWVSATPEEQVRQGLIKHMVTNLGFPPESLVVEKALDQMPHLVASGRKIPDRRADIVCFAKDLHKQHSFFPLLLIECKAVEITQPVILQVIGYNQHMQAHFVCVVNENDIRVGWMDPKLQQYRFVPKLPTYQELRQSVKL